MSAFFASGDSGLTLLNTALQQESYRLGKDISRRTLHVSPWLTCTRQTAFADGMGHTQTSLIYERALPTTDTAGNTRGVTWGGLANLETTNTFSPSANSTFVPGDGSGPLAGATVTTVGPSGLPNANSMKSYLNLARKMKSYALERAVIESPKISLEDLRFAAFREEQIRAITDLMSEATRFTWEERYRDEYTRVAANYVLAKSASTTIASTGEGVAITALPVDPDGDGCDITANLSNPILDKVYQRLVRQGAGARAWGQENGRPIFAVVLSSEASYNLQTAAGFRDDVRYNNARVSELIAPLGVEKSFRGFYHLIDDLAPRFNYDADSDLLVRVDPYAIAGGIVTDNALYDSAQYEAAIVLHQDVMESQIPNPYSGSGAIKFQPVNFRGDFRWTNIPDMERNPDGTIGFFRGILASATKSIKTEFGYVVLFDRTSATLAA